MYHHDLTPISSQVFTYPISIFIFAKKEEKEEKKGKENKPKCQPPQAGPAANNSPSSVREIPPSCSRPLLAASTATSPLTHKQTFAPSPTPPPHQPKKKKKKPIPNHDHPVLPDGRTVVVALPADLDALRRRHKTTADPPVQIEVVVHGSDEHRDLLRLSRTHHATRHAVLRDKVGGEVVDELEKSRVEVEGLDRQLRAIEGGGEEGGRLGVNFGKFGFDAKLRCVWR